MHRERFELSEREPRQFYRLLALTELATDAKKVSNPASSAGGFKFSKSKIPCKMKKAEI